MRIVLAAILWAALSPLPAYANCECKCLDARVQSVCTAPNDVPVACSPASCTGALPEGLPPIAATPVPQAPAAVVNPLPQAQPQPQQQAVQEPGPVTTIPPSITGPASGPPAFSPDGRRSSGNRAASTTGQAQETTTSPSITGSDPPTIVAPNPQSLCFERRVFNSDTLEYEWRRACD